MGISKYNSEGYHDPTSMKPFPTLRKRKKRQSVCTGRWSIYAPPMRGCKTNVNMARVYSRFAVRNTCIPLTPHLLYPQFMDDGSPAERELALFMGLVLLTKCEQVWVFGGVISSWDAGRDCESGKEEHTGAVFHRGIGGDAMRELNIAYGNNRQAEEMG